MNENTVLEQIIEALEVVLQAHEASGRHELNRTDTERALLTLEAKIGAEHPASQRATLTMANVKK